MLRRPVTQLAIADCRTIFRRYAAGGIGFPHSYRWRGDCIDCHFEYSFFYLSFQGYCLFVGFGRRVWPQPIVMPGQLAALQIGNDGAHPFQLGFKHHPQILGFEQEKPR